MTAGAMVTEPPIQGATTGETVPKPTPDAEIGIEMARGFSAAAGTLPGLFASRGETLDYVRDAQTKPGTFSPECGWTGQLVLNGGGCRIGLGWYNATEGATTPPAKTEIYELVPATFPMCPAVIDPASSCCDDADFCPLATYDTTQTPNHRWNMAPFSAASIRADSRYKGGLIGFALMGATSNGQCSQNKYSQLDLNDKSPSGQAWVGAVIYRSTVDPSAYYLAFESLPTSVQSWKGQNNGGDGDFNDFVLYLKGTCPDMGTGGASGAAGHAGAPGTGGLGGGAGAAGGRPGASGGTQAVGGGGGKGLAGGGGSDVRGGGGRGGDGGGSGDDGGRAAGGASLGSGASSTGGSSSGGENGSAGGGGGRGASPSSPSSSGCSCATILGDGREGSLPAGLILAIAVCRRRRRRA
jgi:hypothetical protein